MTAACPRCGSIENLDTYGVCDGPCPTGADPQTNAPRSTSAPTFQRQYGDRPTGADDRYPNTELVDLWVP